MATRQAKPFLFARESRPGASFAADGTQLTSGITALPRCSCARLHSSPRASERRRWVRARNSGPGLIPRDYARARTRARVCAQPAAESEGGRQSSRGSGTWWLSVVAEPVGRNGGRYSRATCPSGVEPREILTHSLSLSLSFVRRSDRTRDRATAASIAPRCVRARAKPDLSSLAPIFPPAAALTSAAHGDEGRTRIKER